MKILLSGLGCSVQSSLTALATAFWHSLPHFNGGHISHRLFLPMTEVGRDSKVGLFPGWTPLTAPLAPQQPWQTFLWTSVNNVSTQHCFLPFLSFSFRVRFQSCCDGFSSLPWTPPHFLLQLASHRDQTNAILTGWNLSTFSLSSFHCSFITSWQHNNLILQGWQVSSLPEINQIFRPVEETFLFLLLLQIIILNICSFLGSVQCADGRQKEVTAFGERKEVVACWNGTHLP